MSKGWMVRAGRGGYLIDSFAEGVVAIGWKDVGVLSQFENIEELRKRYCKEYPNDPPGKISSAISVLNKFSNVISVGDRVISYDPTTRKYLVGNVSSEYSFDPDLVEGHPHIRRVNWQAPVNRDDLSQRTRNSLGSTLTLFTLNGDVFQEISAVQSGATPKSEQSAESDESEDSTEERRHIAEEGKEKVKDRISGFDDRQVEELVACLLRAMGYRTRLTPRGPDRGVDVLASPDGLGLAQPRIKVEVKHRRRTQMGAPEIRSFVGAFREGDRGLYVSTGGFSKEARYEADRANIPVTLLTLEELATLIIEHYENFDIEARTLLPLVKVYERTDLNAPSGRAGIFTGPRSKKSNKSPDCVKTEYS